MNIKINSNEIKGGTTAAMIEEAAKRLAFLEEEIAEDTIVKLSVKNDGRKIVLSANITLKNNHHIRHSTVGETYYEAVDEMKDCLKRQIRKDKEKQRDRKRKHAVKPVETTPISEIERKIGKRKFTAVSVMSEEQAIAEKENLGHDFYIFRNADNNDELSVMYNRFEGDYGILVIK